MDTSPRPERSVPGHVDRNIETIGQLVSKAEQRITRQQRAVERLTSRLGRPHTVYSILALVIVWTLFNMVEEHFGVHEPDPPPFYWLQGVMSLTALLTTILVLTSQNRQMAIAEQRAHLDLQINLLTEQKVTKLIALVEELRRDLPDVRDRRDTIAERMQEPVDPAAVVVALDDTLSQAVEAAARTSQGDTPEKAR